MRIPAVLLSAMFLSSAHPAVSAPLVPLSVRGTDITDAEGRVVPMRGINFGGWLMLETWISGVEREWDRRMLDLARETGVESELKDALTEAGDFDDDVEKIGDYIARLHKCLKTRVGTEKFAAYLELYNREPPVFAAADFDRVLRRRFGDNGAAEIWNTYHDTWYTETEFQLAKALGFNFVRLPFWYRWFEDDSRPYEYNDYGFSYLDKAVAWARENGLYVMLDFHGAPGGQSPWDHTGEMSRNEFFNCDECLKRTAALWAAIARRYRDEPAVFAYDTLNEPFSAKDLEDWTRVQDALYKAIRSGDPDGIVVMEEGYKLENLPWLVEGFFPKPEERGWTDVVYSFHFYAGSGHRERAELVRNIAKREQERCGVPMYAGEFSTMSGSPEGLEGMRVYCSMFNEEGWMWSPWTFKYVDGEGEGAMWGVFCRDGQWPGINIHRDSREQIKEKVRLLGAGNFSIHGGYAQVLRECLSPPAKSTAP